MITPPLPVASTSRAAPDGAPVPELRTATAADRPAVERLLVASDLPTAGLVDLFAGHAGDFVVAEDPTAPGELAAVGGLEVCGDSALLRSVAVRPAWRRHGLGQALVRRLDRRGEERGVRALYLLTTTAEHYFSRLGFATVDRGGVPPAIAATLEFRTVCPASAVAMARPLGG